MNDMNATVDYSGSVGEKMNWSCIYGTFDIIYCRHFFSTKFIPFNNMLRILSEPFFNSAV